MTEYARSLGLKVHDVQAPSFATNYLLYTPPRKQEDGSFVLGLPFSPDTPVPISDIKHDFGKYVVAAVEQDLDTVYAAPEYLTASQIAAEFAKGALVWSRRRRDLHLTRHHSQSPGSQSRTSKSRLTS